MNLNIVPMEMDSISTLSALSELQAKLKVKQENIEILSIQLKNKINRIEAFEKQINSANDDKTFFDLQNRYRMGLNPPLKSHKSSKTSQTSQTSQTHKNYIDDLFLLQTKYL